MEPLEPKRMAKRRIFAFERDPYLNVMDSSILTTGLENKKPWAVLDDTLFYPEGGGQPADGGLINGLKVEDVRRTQDQILHFVTRPLEPGPARLELDWSRRYDHMQQHSGQHLLTAVAADVFGWSTRAFHLGEERCDVELDVGALDAGQLGALQEELATRIRAALAITSRRVSMDRFKGMDVRTRGLPAGHTGSVRLVSIKGTDLNTCGGTHVSNTAEIEVVALLGTESMRGGVRLYFMAGRRARRRLARHEERNRALRELLGVGDDAMVDALANRLNQAGALSQRVRGLQRDLSRSVARELIDSGEPVVERHFEDLDMTFLQEVGRGFQAGAGDRLAFLTSRTSGNQGIFVLVAGQAFPHDLKLLGSVVAEVLEGRGGGAQGIFQGKASRITLRSRALLALMQKMGS